MQKLSVKKELLIIRLYLQGLSYDEIAARAGVAKGTVSNVISGLKVGRFPEFGDLADQIELLRELALDLRRFKLTLVEAAIGVSVLARLQDLEVEPPDIERCADVGRALATEGIEAHSFGKAALALEEVRERTGLGFEELESKVRNLEEQASRLEPLALRVRDCEGELTELEARKESLISETARLEKNQQELDRKLRGKEERDGNLSRRLVKLEERVQTADEQLTRAREDLKVLSSMGMSSDDLFGFTQRLGGIAQRHGIGPNVLRDWLWSQLEQLNEGLGMDAIIKVKRRELQTTQKTIDTTNEQLASLKGTKEELRSEQAKLHAALEQERKHIVTDLKSIKEAVQDTIAQVNQSLTDGLEEGIAEVLRLRDQALELGKEMGKYGAILESNPWLQGLLSLAKGDTSIDARQVRESSLPILRGLSIYLDANAIAGGSSYLAKRSIDNALAELARWKLK